MISYEENRVTHKWNYADIQLNQPKSKKWKQFMLYYDDTQV